jgi:hypothetical protein
MKNIFKVSVEFKIVYSGSESEGNPINNVCTAPEPRENKAPLHGLKFSEYQLFIFIIPLMKSYGD